MSKRTANIFKLLLAFALTLCLAFAIGCGKTGDSGNEPEKPNDTDEVKPISVVTGFEEDGSLNVIACGGGTAKSINANKDYVLTGDKSLKLHVSQFADAQFSFSENIIEKNISDYEYVSFWIYVDYDGVIKLSNTSNGSAVDAAIDGGQWKRVKIEKGSPIFNIIKYNLSFNSFVLSAEGADFGKVVEYDVYIDDVRLYKDGEAGECEMLFDSAEGYTGTPERGIAGVEYTLPEVYVFSPAGYRIYGADESVNKAVFDENGNAVKITNGKVQIDKAGVYTLICTYTYQGIENKLISDLSVLFVETEDVYTGMHTVGERVTVPALTVNDPATGNPATGVSVSVKVTKPDGSEFNYDNAGFVADAAGRYTVSYTVSGKAGNTDNTVVYESDLWVQGISGLLADFNSDEIRMFETDAKSSAILIENSSENYKRAKNENKVALKAKVKDNKAPRISFTDNFPVQNMDGAKYLSMWIYNGSAIELTVELTNCSQLCTAKAGAWSMVVFDAENFYAGFREQSILLYDAKTQAGLNCNLFIDDVRIIREGDPEEVKFSDKVTTTDYNPADKSGRRFSLNTEYELDLTVSTVSGAAISGKATVEGVKDRRNRDVAVKSGKLITPTTNGLHTVTLVYEADGILNTFEKTIDATEQVLISPDGKFMLKPGEQGIKYNFNVLPEIWNHGVIDTNTDVEISLYDEKSNEVTVTGNAFVPESAGKYQVFIMAKDKQNEKENALLETSLLVYESGKYGMIADFENGDSSVMEALIYYYGEISEFAVTDEKAHSGDKCGIITNMSDDTQSIFFHLAANNRAGDISDTAYFSFWIYVEDAAGDNDYTLVKAPYAGWINERDPSYVVGSLRQSFVANRWVEVKIMRADYESVLGGTIFAGGTIGGWTAPNNDFITSFLVYAGDGMGRISKGIKIYVDDFTLGY